jgi:hypothetical protein
MRAGDALARHFFDALINSSKLSRAALLAPIDAPPRQTRLVVTRRRAFQYSGCQGAAALGFSRARVST